MSFMCTASTFVEVVRRVPLHLARGFIHLSCDSIQAHACGRPASWLSLTCCPSTEQSGQQAPEDHSTASSVRAPWVNLTSV